MKISLSPRAALVLIAALFIGPLLAAWLMYAGVINFGPVATRNLGELVEPPVPLDWSGAEMLDLPDTSAEERFLEHWAVLHPVTDPCEAACILDLENLRQVHKASGRHQDRIRLAIVLPPGSKAATRQQLRDVYGEFVLLSELDGRLSQSIERAGSGGSNYLIDPLGNIMMRYEADADPNHLKKDLKRLLTWSKLDEQ